MSTRDSPSAIQSVQVHFANWWGLKSIFGRQLRVIGALLLVGVSSCVISDGGGDRPSASVEVNIELEPGATETYIFDIEAESMGGRESFDVRTVPSALGAQGLDVDQSWVREGVEEEGWPEFYVVEPDELLLGAWHLTLTNPSQTRVEFELIVQVMASSSIPAPTEEDLRLEIRRR